MAPFSSIFSVTSPPRKTLLRTKHSIPQSLIRVSFDSGNGTGAFEEIGFEFGAVEVGIAAINQPHCMRRAAEPETKGVAKEVPVRGA